jgi:hypothetical protein
MSVDEMERCLLHWKVPSCFFAALAWLVVFNGMPTTRLYCTIVYMCLCTCVCINIQYIHTTCKYCTYTTYSTYIHAFTSELSVQVSFADSCCGVSTPPAIPGSGMDQDLMDHS